MRLPELGASGVPGHHLLDEFCLRLLRRSAVFVYPGTHFGLYGEGYIRISLLAPLTRLMEGLDRIGQFWTLSLRPKE